MATDPWAGFEAFQKESKTLGGSSKKDDPWAGFDAFQKQKKEPEKKPEKKGPVVLSRRAPGPRQDLLDRPTLSQTPQEKAIVETRKLPAELWDVAKEGLWDRGLKPLGSALKNYINKPEKTTPTQDVLVAGETAIEAGRAVSRTAFNFVESITSTATKAGRLYEEGLEKEGAGKARLAGAQMFTDAAASLDATIKDSHARLKQGFGTLERVKTSDVEVPLAILQGGLAAGELVTTDAAEAILGSFQRQPVLGQATGKLMEAMQATRGAIAWGVRPLLFNASLNDEQKDRFADTVAGFGTMFAVTKSIQGTQKGISTVFNKASEKIAERRTIKKAEITNAEVDSIVRDAFVETIDPKAETALGKTRQAVTTPLDQGGARRVASVERTERLAFESEMADNFGRALGDLGDQAARDGFEIEMGNFQKKAPEGVKVTVEDAARADFPAFFDLESNAVVFNYPKLRSHLTALAKGDVIIYGDRANPKLFERKPGETFEQLQRRYTEELYKHEVAHANTIAPEDIARLRDAESRGDAPEARRITQELERRANEFMVKESTKVMEGQTQYEIAKFESDAEIVAGARTRIEELKFDRDAMNKGYEAWARAARASEDVRRMGVEELAARRKESDAAAGRRYALGKDADATLQRFRARLESEMNIRAEVKDAQKRVREADPEIRKAMQEARKEIETKVRAEEDIKRMVDRGVEIAKRKQVEARLKGKIESKKEAQKIIGDYLKEMKIPRAHRGLALASVINAKTPDGARKALQKIDAEYSLFNRRETKKKIKAQIKKTEAKVRAGVRQGKFDAETQIAFDRIRSALFPRKGESKVTYEEAFNAKVELIREHRQQKEMGEIPIDIERELSILSVMGLDGQNVSQLKESLAIVKELAETGKIRRNEAIEKLERRALSLNKKVLEDTGITETGNLKPESTGILNALGNYFKTNMGPDYIFEWISKDAKIEGSSALGRVFKQVKDAQARRETKTNEAKDQLMVKTHEAWGYDLAKKGDSKAMYKETMEFLTKKQAIKVEGGKSLELTRSEMLNLVGYAQNARVRKQLTNENNGWTEAQLKAVEAAMPAKDKKLLEAVVEGYAEAFPRFDEAFRADTGTPLGYIERYLPLHVRNAEGVRLEQSIADDMLRSYEPKQKPSLRPGAVKTRSPQAQGQIDISGNPFAEFVGWQTRTNHYIETFEVAKVIDKAFDKKFMTGLQNKYGKAVAKQFADWKDNVKRGGLESMKEYQKWMELRNNASAYILQATAPVLGQLASTPQWMTATAKLSDYPKYILEYARSPRRALQYVYDSSPTFRRRYELKSYLRELNVKNAKEVARDFSGKKSLKDIADIPLAKMDKLGISPGMYASIKSWEAEFRSRGRSPEGAKRLAVEKAEWFLDNTQSSTDWTGKGGFERGLIGRLLISFANQPIKMTNYMVMSTANLKRGKITPKQYAARFMATAILSQAAYAALNQGSKNAVEWLSGGELDDEDSIWRRMRQEIMLGPIQGMPYVRDAFNLWYRSITGQYTKTPTPVALVSFEEVVNGLGQISSEDLDNAMVHFLKAGAAFAGAGWTRDFLKALDKATEN